MKKEDLQKELDELGIKYQENDTNEQLTLMLNGHKAIEENKNLKEDNEKLKELNGRLNEQVSLSDASKPTLHLMKVGDKTYHMPAKSMTLSKRVADKLKLEDNVVTREIVKKDKKLAKALVEDIKSGFLVEVVESEKEKS